MASFKIQGGKPLKGQITPIPNKNAILPLITAAVLADEPVTFTNVPKSTSVRVMLRIFKELGGRVSYIREDGIRLNASSIKDYKIDQELALKERASLMFVGPLLARFKKAEIASAGGCKLGNRPIDALFQGIKSLGTKITMNECYRFETSGLRGRDDIWLIEASVTGTENLILAAVKAQGSTTIYNAACEPHVADLCNFLVSIGAKISGIGTNKLVIKGVDKLKGGQWKVIADHIDIGGLIVAAAITGGEILIKDAIPEHMTQVLNYFAKVNLKVEIRGNDIFVPKDQNLVCKKNVKGDIDKIMDQPWPGYPVDLIPQAVVLAAKAKESIRIYGIMYETQLLFVQDLLRMNAKVDLVNAHEVITFGPSQYSGAELNSPSILQCAHALVLAALSAKGTTIIRNTEIISRRYPNLVKRLKRLGADIQKVR